MGDSKVKRDSKDPMPTENNSQRVGGGNEAYPAGKEKHNQKKAERVTVASRFDLVKPGPEQPERNSDGNKNPFGINQTGGNIAADQAREDHDQKKAQYIKPASRFPLQMGQETE